MQSSRVRIPDDDFFILFFVLTFKKGRSDQRNLEELFRLVQPIFNFNY